MDHVSQKRREEFEFTQHKEMIKAYDDRYVNYPELIITQ
jgi:hypothetical protein